MAITRYVVAATPSSPEAKVISNLKSAKAEADARAKLDRVDVEVHTQATGKLTYTAKGAPVAVETPAEPAPEPVAEETPAPAEETPAEDGDAEPEIEIDPETQDAFEAALAEIIGEPTGEEPPAAEDEDDTPEPPADEEEEEEDETETDGEEADAPAAAEPAKGDHRGVLDCGCSVEKVIETGEHGPKCADAAKAQERAKAVERDRPARAPRTGGGATRREAIGEAAVEGWELLYDKPRQKAQVGRKDGKYALICTTHKHAHPLRRLVEERALRQGKRSVWCPECADK